MKSPQREMWIEAMNREKACHLKNGTFGQEMAKDQVQDGASRLGL